MGYRSVFVCLALAAGLVPECTAAGQTHATAAAPEQATTRGPVGFASLDGGTPGGDPTHVCPVATPSDDALRAAIDCATKAPSGGVVVFTTGKPVMLAGPIELPSNISITGPATIQTNATAVFVVSGQHNVVIRNISFQTLPGGTAGNGRLCPDPVSPYTPAVGNEERPGVTGCTKPIILEGTHLGKGAVSSNVADTKNVWIDHNTFSRCGDKCIVVRNDAKNTNGKWSGADDITISSNKFLDSFFSVFITVTGKEAEDGPRHPMWRDTAKCEAEKASGILPRMRVSVYNNLFDRIRQRSARAAYCSAYVHEFNNVIENFGLPASSVSPSANCSTPGVFGFGPSAHSGATLLLENNYIAAWPHDPNGCKAAVQTNATGDINDASVTDWGYVREVGDVFTNGAYGASYEANRVAAPPYPYTLIPTSQVYDFVLRNAGASEMPIR